MVRPHHRQSESEDGAVAVLTAITIFALLGIVALALDVGLLWVHRRATASQADSAALATIVALREGGNCSAVQALAAEAVKADGGDFTQTKAEPLKCETGQAKVAVEQTTTVDLAFAGIFNVNQGRAYARSVAEYGAVTALAKLRPIGLCVKTPAYQDYFLRRAPDADEIGKSIFPMPTGGAAYRIDFTRETAQGSDCNPNENGKGNWGWLDFDGPGGGRAELADRLLNPYGGVVTADLDGWGKGGADVGDCEPPTGADDGCPPQTGGGGTSVEPELRQLLCPVGSDPYLDCEVMWILIFDTILGSASGQGQNARFYPVGFAPVVLRDFHKISGVASDKKYLDPTEDTDSGSNACRSTLVKTTPDAGWFCFEFLDLDAPGSIGRQPDEAPIVRTSTVIHLCGVEIPANDRCAVS